MARILVVEDDSDSRMMLGKLVDLSGHDLAFATNGWEALLTIDSSNVDLILLDLMMPGMDGPTFLRILQQGAKQSKIPVAVVTALDGADVSKRIGDLATIAILPKDAHLVDNLLALIQATLPPSPSIKPNPALDKRIN